MTKRIKLYGQYTEQFGYYALVDDADYPDLIKYRWRVSSEGYAISGMKVDHPTNPLRIMHRLIASALNGDIVDHVNNIGLDNRRRNLRIVNHSSNAKNSDGRGGISGYKGVYWRANRSKWIAVVNLPNGKKQTVGHFDSEIQAAKAYNRAMKQHYGDTLIINDLSGDTADHLRILQKYISGQIAKPDTLPLPTAESLIDPSAVMQIPLAGKHGQGKFALVSGQDYKRLIAHTWQMNKAGYVTRGHKSGGTVYMHREIISAPKGMVIDHVDCDKLNNTRSNLRIATPTENAFNTDKVRSSTSKHRGVHYSNRRKAWVAKIFILGKEIYIGQFASENEAAEAYDAYLRTVIKID